jgi:acetyl esterase/lipase
MAVCFAGHPISAAPPIPARGTSLATPAQRDALPLPTGADGSLASEQWFYGNNGVRIIRNVTSPSLTPFLPAPGEATGAAVIVAPGGGFRELYVDNEGYMVARWLAARGIAAFVLKYRINATPRGLPSPLQAPTPAPAASGAAPAPRPGTPQPAIDDGVAALRLVRSRAAEWKIDPARVGFLGFSAGAALTMSVALLEDPASRPDFIGYIYGAMGARTVPAYAPPMFAAFALTDPLIGRGDVHGLTDSWRAAGRPVELHMYGEGGHGFSMSPRFAAAPRWIEQFHAWMQDRKLVPMAAN